MKVIKLKPLLIAIAIPLIVGGLSALITSGSMQVFETINKPSFAPPGYLFPIVWTILYILMGISSYLVYMSDSRFKEPALKFYAIQLGFNFLWSIFFFNFKLYTFSFIWLVALFILIVIMIYFFYKVNKTAAYLQIPYLLWVAFAGILNLSIALLN